MKYNSTWLQKDIHENKLAFQLYRKTYSNVEDKILFSISAPQCETIEHLSLDFKYYSTDEQKNAVQVALKPVQVRRFNYLIQIRVINIIKYNITPTIFVVLKEKRKN